MPKLNSISVNRGRGKGWYEEPVRHHRARKYGRAGEVYHKRDKSVGLRSVKVGKVKLQKQRIRPKKLNEDVLKIYREKQIPKLNEKFMETVGIGPCMAVSASITEKLRKMGYNARTYRAYFDGSDVHQITLVRFGDVDYIVDLTNYFTDKHRPIIVKKKSKFGRRYRHLEYMGDNLSINLSSIMGGPGEEEFEVFNKIMGA